MSLRRSTTSRSQRALCVLLLAVLTCGMIGLPINRHVAVNRERFPCEQCACGCVTAAACWDKCCCHSDAEKLDWAAENGVTPPMFLVERVAIACTLVADRPSTSPACHRCSHPQPVTADEPHLANASSAAGGEQKAMTSRGIIRLEDAAKCRGIDWLLSTFAGAVIATRQVSLARPEPRLLFVLMIRDDHADSVPDRPDPPVPWV